MAAVDVLEVAAPDLGEVARDGVVLLLADAIVEAVVVPQHGEHPRVVVGDLAQKARHHGRLRVDVYNEGLNNHISDTHNTRHAREWEAYRRGWWRRVGRCRPTTG